MISLVPVAAIEPWMPGTLLRRFAKSPRVVKVPVNGVAVPENELDTALKFRL